MEITTLSGDKKSVFTEGISLLTGIHYMDSLDDYDIVFKSPGVVLPKAADDYPCLITSQTEVFFEVYREQIIGITGTKGKSTTSTLLYYILRESGMDTVLAGISAFRFSIFWNRLHQLLVLCVNCPAISWNISMCLHTLQSF